MVESRNLDVEFFGEGRNSSQKSKFCEDRHFHNFSTIILKFLERQKNYHKNRFNSIIVSIVHFLLNWPLPPIETS